MTTKKKPSAKKKPVSNKKPPEPKKVEKTIDVKLYLLKSGVEDIRDKAGLVFGEREKVKIIMEDGRCNGVTFAECERPMQDALYKIGGIFMEAIDAKIKTLSFKNQANISFKTLDAIEFKTNEKVNEELIKRKAVDYLASIIKD